MNKAKLASLVSSFLTVLATAVITPYSPGLVHQPKAPKELYKK